MFISHHRGRSRITAVAAVGMLTIALACRDGARTTTPGVVVGGSAPKVSSVSTNPSEPVWGEEFTITVNGSGFDPAHAQIVFSGAGCASADWCIVDNTSLTTKTANQLVGPATLNAPGGYGVAVRNGAEQTASEPTALAVSSSAADNCPAASGLALPVSDDNPNDNLKWDVPGNPFANYLATYNGHHPGEDWNLVGGSPNDDLGKPVRAIANGVVARTSSLGGLGSLVVLQHRGSFRIPARSSTTPSYSYPEETVSSLYSAYVHIEKLPAGIKKDQCVQQGDILGYIMNPGAGPHLHFEIRHPRMRPSGNWSLILPTSNWSTVNGDNTGYYKNVQMMVDSGMVHPRAIIQANEGSAPPSYTITTSANPAAGGSTAGGGTHQHGAPVSVSATPAAGYTFVHWAENGSQVSTNSTYTFTAIANRSLVANFTGAPPQTHTVTTTSSPSAGGTTSGGGTYTAGTTVTVAASPASGYTFSNWTESGSVVSSAASYQFTLAGNRSLVANFSAAPPQSYTVSTSSNLSSGGTTSGGGSYAAGTAVTVTASPASGYTFSSWAENGSVVSSAASYQFTLTGNRSLVANFSAVPPSSYSISVSASPAAGGSVSGGASYTAGAQATVSASPASNYEFVNWTENGTQVSSTASYQFSVTRNRTLVANFRLKTYTISLSSNPTGGGSTSGTGTYNAGGSATVTATPAAGYQFVRWTESGSSVSTSATYQFTVNGNRSLTAQFTSAPVSLANGEHFRVTGTQTVYLVFGGKRYGYQDFGTLQTCTGNRTSVVREVASMPSIPDGGVLPSSASNPWLNGSAPIKLANENTIWVVIGCVRSGVQDEATYEAIFGDRNFSRVVTVSAGVLNATPVGPTALAARLRPAGTLIQGSGQEVRWVVYNGGSLGISSPEVLSSHCRTFSEIRSVSNTEFNSYVPQANLHQATSCQ